MEPDKAVIAELSPKGFPGLKPRMSLHAEEWEYIRDSRGGEELYRWRQDPDEQVNLASLAEYQPVISALRDRLRDLISHSRRPWQGGQYLSALDEPRQPFVNVATSTPEPAFGERFPGPWIGDVQERFPPKVVRSTVMPDESDADLLQSLPYH